MSRAYGSREDVRSSCQHRQIRRPRADLITVLLRQDASDLRDVAEVVHDPRGEQLSEGDWAEARMLAGKRQLFGCQSPGTQQLQVFLSQIREFVQVTDNVERAERVGAFGAASPCVRQSTKQRRERVRRALEDFNGAINLEV